MEWKNLEGRYTNGKGLYLGKMCVATVMWNSGRNKNDPNTHAAEVELPGMKKEFRHHNHASEQQAMSYVELIVKGWVKGAGLEFK